MDGLSKSWGLVGVQGKLHILIQGALIILFFLLMQWLSDRFEMQIERAAESRAELTADGLINGMNMLMLTDQISNPENRRVLLSKMAQSKGIVEVRIIRGRAVVEQFGAGLPEEQPVDDMDREVLATGKTMFRKLSLPDGRHTLRVVMPFIAKENYRGTNCLSCHSTASGGVNGAASVVIDLTDEELQLAEIKNWLWFGNAFVQIVIMIIIAVFVRFVFERNIARPVKNLQLAMSEIQGSNDLSKRADVDELNPDVGEMARSFNTLLTGLEDATGRLELFAKMFESSSEGIIITDAEQNIIEVNPSFEEITQYSAAEAVGKTPKLLSSGRHTAEFYDFMWTSLHLTGKWSGEIWNRRKSGEVYPEWISIAAMKNAKGQVVNYIALFSDISKRKEAEQRIEFLAHHDFLTKLPNRALFEDRLKRSLVIANRNQTKVGLMFLDLDRFKDINDTMGHLEGDKLLQSIAERLRSCMRESDTVSRQGGDEFVILLEDINDNKDVENIARKIMDAMRSPHRLGAQYKTVSFSIGAAIYPEDASDGVALMRCADQAMYRAKDAGRNNFKLFSEMV